MLFRVILLVCLIFFLMAFFVRLVAAHFFTAPRVIQGLKILGWSVLTIALTCLAVFVVVQSDHLL